MARAEIPEAMESEDGSTYWLQGHQDPPTALLAVVLNTMVNVGAEEAMQLLVGGEATSSWTYNAQLDRANDLLNDTAHVWLREDPDNDENMIPCEPDHPAATAWTRLAVE